MFGAGGMPRVKLPLQRSKNLGNARPGAPRRRVGGWSPIYSGAMGRHEAAAHFEVQGLRLSVTGSWPEVVENLRLDLGWFETPARDPADVEITVERRAPDFDAFGEVAATFVTPRN